MKLPEGKVEATYKDQEKSFPDILSEIKEKGFEGYLKVISEQEARPLNSYLIFDKGKPILAIYEEGDSQIQGEKALTNALKQILTHSSVFEYHKGVDISLMSIYFPKARIEGVVGDVDTLLSRFEETRAIIEEELKKKEEEERIRSSIREHVNEWKEDGYIVTGIEAVMDADIGSLQKVYEEYKGKISRLKELEADLDEFDADIYGEDTKPLYRMLNDPDRIEDLEQGLAALKEKVEEDRQRREAVKKKIEQWEAEGYVTKRLRPYLEKDVETLWEAYTKFFEDLQALEELGETLNKLESSTKSYRDRFEDIRGMLKDPDRVEDIKNGIRELEGLLESEKKRREMIRARVEEWEKAGLNVEGIKGLVDSAPIEDLEKAIEDYENALARIEVMKDKISGIKRDWYPDMFDKLEETFKDPMNMDEIEGAYKSLIERYEEDEKKRVEFREKIQGWKSQGYVVPPMDDLFDSPIETLEAGIKKIEETIENLKRYEEELQALRTKGYEAEIMEILSRMYDLTAVEEIEERYQALMARVKEDEEKRKKLQAHIEELESEGYDVSSVKELMDAKLEDLWDAYTTLVDNIETLREAQERLESINPIGHEADVEELNKIIKNPAMADQVMDKVKALEEAVNKELSRRTEIKATLDEYKEKGYDTGAVEGLITAPIDELERNFETFLKGIGIIEKIRERLENIEEPWYATKIEELKSKLKDPFKAEDLEVEVMEFEKRVREENEKRAEMEAHGREWEERGYNVEGLKKAIKTAPFTELEGVFNRFKEAIGRMEELKTRLEGIEIYGHDDEINQIRDMMNDIGNLPEVSKKVGEIERIAEEEKTRRAELKARVREWAEKGYELGEAVSIVDTGPIETAEQLVSKIASDVEELKRIEYELEGMKIKGHEEELASIKAKIKNPMEIGAVREEFHALKAVIEEEERKREELRKRLEAWKENGYNVSRLEQIIDGDLQSIVEQFNIFEGDIQHLRSVEADLDKIDMKGHDEDINRIKALCKDPANIKEVDAEFAKLKDVIDNEKKQIEQMKETIKRWKQEGYITTRLEGLDETNYETFKEKVGAFQEDINRLKALRAQLEQMDVRWHEDMAKEIESKLYNPDAIGIIERKMDDLKAILEAEAHERESLREKIEKWRMEGFKADALLENFEDKSLDQIKGEMEKFEVKIKQLMELQRELGVGHVSSEAEEGEGVVEERPIELNPDFTFETFVVGASNRFTHAAAQAVANNPAKAYNPLFIYGGPGLGKTHLIHAIGNYIKTTKPELNIMYITTEQFVNELLNAIRRNKIESFRTKYRNVDVLLIDDIQFISGHQETQEEFFHTFNSLYSARKQIVITSDRPPKDIAKLEERLRSRFEGGLITDIQPPSLETKIIILRRIAKKEGIPVPDDVIHLIGSSIKSNVRKLEGALNKLIAYAKINKVDVTYDLAEDLLREEFLSEGEGGKGEREKAALGEKEGAAAVPNGAPKEEIGGETKGPVVAGAEKETKVKPVPKAKEEAKGEVASGVEESAKQTTSASGNVAGTQPGSIIDEKLASLKEKLASTGADEGTFGGKAAGETLGAAPRGEKPTVKEPPGGPTGGEPNGLEGEGVVMAECAACGKLIPLDATQCPYCGAIFEEPGEGAGEGPEGGEAVMAECAACGKLIPLDATQCPYCGAIFEEPGEGAGEGPGEDSGGEKVPSEAGREGAESQPFKSTSPTPPPKESDEVGGGMLKTLFKKRRKKKKK